MAKAGAGKSAVVQAIFEVGERVNDQMLASGMPKYQKRHLLDADVPGKRKPAGAGQDSGLGTWKLAALGWESPLDVATAAICFQKASKGSKIKDEAC